MRKKGTLHHQELKSESYQNQTPVFCLNHCVKKSINIY